MRQKRSDRYIQLKSFLCGLLAFLFLCPLLPSLLRFIRFDVYVVLSLLPAPPPPLPSHLPPVSRFCAHSFLSSHSVTFRFTIFDGCVIWLRDAIFIMAQIFSTKCGAVALKLSGAVFRHIVSLLVSHGFASVSHPKLLFRFEAKQAKLGGQFRYFASKSFASFRFSFASKRNSGTP